MELTEYKNHPRILELFIITFYNRIAQDYGIEQARQLFNAFVNVTGGDWTRIQGILMQAPTIRALEKKNKKLYKQQMLLLAHLYDISRYELGQILNVTPQTFYNEKGSYKFDQFVTQEFLHDLDNHIVICGMTPYQQEAIRFIRDFRRLIGNLKNVPSPEKVL